MTHDDTISRLPWYLAGTLDPQEEAAVGEHLASCSVCRAELERTRVVARLYAAEHPTAEELIEAASDPAGSPLRDSLEAHLSDCAECREAMALLRTSRAGEPESERLDGKRHEELDEKLNEEPLTFRPTAAGRPPLRWLAAAAMVGLLFGMGLLSLEVRKLGTENAVLRADHQVPRAGVPVVELLPETALRGEAVVDHEVVIDPDSAPYVVLLLALENPHSHSSFLARWVDSEEVEHFVSEPGAPDTTGALVLVVPSVVLPQGNGTIEVLAGGKTGDVVGSYRVSVVASGRDQP